MLPLSSEVVVYFTKQVNLLIVFHSYFDVTFEVHSNVYTNVCGGNRSIARPIISEGSLLSQGLTLRLSSQAYTGRLYDINFHTK